MTAILLFCISEEAKPFVHQVLSIKLEESGTTIFYLVESRTCPSASKDFKEKLGDDETFDTDFINASEQECQQWALEMQYRVNFIEQDIIAIVDARSARDKTLLIQFYSNGTPVEFGRYGFLPPEGDTWYDFRIDHQKAPEIYVSLTELAEELSYPVYFGHKEQLTSEQGIFDVDRAETLICEGDPAIFELQEEIEQRGCLREPA